MTGPTEMGDGGTPANAHHLPKYKKSGIKPA
jgi:hypothetical protein